MGRTLVYTDYAYHRVDGRVYSERAFSLFLGRVASELDGEMTIIGRLSEEPAAARYEIGAGVGFVALPYYRSIASLGAIVAMARSLGAGWRAIGDAEVVWLLGPHPLMVLFALFGLLRGRRVYLGVRQDTPSYLASRHPGRRLIRTAAWFLDRSFRLLARVCATVVVGPALARNYAAARRLLEIDVSLVPSSEIVEPEAALAAPPAGPLTALSVGRLDREKNPLMLAEVLELLVAGGDWRLEVCGEGPMAGELEQDLRRRGLADRVELAGYVPFGAALNQRYRDADVLLHSSWTEGFPQVLLEAFAAGLPVVASDVGGIGEAVGGAVSLFAAGDADAAAARVAEIAADPELRRSRVLGGLAYIREHTIEVETARVARFLEA